MNNATTVALGEVVVTSSDFARLVCDGSDFFSAGGLPIFCLIF